MNKEFLISASTFIIVLLLYTIYIADILPTIDSAIYANEIIDFKPG